MYYTRAAHVSQMLDDVWCDIMLLWPSLNIEEHQLAMKGIARKRDQQNSRTNLFAPVHCGKLHTHTRLRVCWVIMTRDVYN